MEKELGDSIQIDDRGRLLLCGQPVGIIREDAGGALAAVVDSGHQCLEINRFLLPRCRSVRFERGVAEKLAQSELEAEVPASRVRIYQLRPEVEPENKFISYQDMLQRNGGVYRDRYVLVFDGDVGSDDPETVYQRLRERPPPGYNGHSLTRSDVLELYSPTKSHCFYIDTYALRPVVFETERGLTMEIQMEGR